jgi:hypothetical protein
MDLAEEESGLESRAARHRKRGSSGSWRAPWIRRIRGRGGERVYSVCVLIVTVGRRMSRGGFILATNIIEQND